MYNLLCVVVSAGCIAVALHEQDTVQLRGIHASAKMQILGSGVDHVPDGRGRYVHVK